MSLERKKARLISAIHDKQIVDYSNETGKMVGSKKSFQKHINNHSYTEKKPTLSINPLIEANENRFYRIDFKKKKNPHMNFSLLYMQEKKKREAESMNSSRRNSRPATGR